MRRTKIVCTMGPATDDDKVLRDLMLAGMDVARLNFSHGSHEEAKARMDRIKRIREELDIPVAILLDTKGPEIRLKSFKDGKAVLKAGEKFTLYTDDVEGDSTGVSITYKDLPKDISAHSLRRISSSATVQRSVWLRRTCDWLSPLQSAMSAAACCALIRPRLPS